MRTTLLAALAATAVLACAARAADDCQLKRLASLDMSIEAAGRIMIPVSIGGHPLTFAVDTGSDHTMITQAAAQALGLQTNLFTGSHNWLWGGARLTSYVNVDDFQIGRTRVGKSQFYVLPQGYGTPGMDGVVGTDVMRYFDVDFDFGSGKLNLFDRYHCSGQVVYWTDESNVAKLSFQKTVHSGGPARPDVDKILFYVTIDGKDFLAVLDTGAAVTTMNLDEAQSAFGLGPDSPGMEKVKLNRPGDSYRYRFKTLAFGGVNVANPEIRLDSYELNKLPGSFPSVIVGMNVLRRLHLYVSYEEHTLYISTAEAK